MFSSVLFSYQCASVSGSIYGHVTDSDTGTEAEVNIF